MRTTPRKLPLTGLVALAATSTLLLAACTHATQTGTDGSA
mgnify:FL=1